MSPVKLFVAIPCYGSIPVQFMQCMLHLQANPPCDMILAPLAGDSLVSRARNTLSAQFLESDCTHLLFIDSDLIFSSEQVARLLSHEKDVVAGFYPKKQDGELQWVCNANLEPNEADENGLQEVRYMGSGFMLIKRCVFEQMIERYGEKIAYHPDSKPETTEWDFWAVGPCAVNGFTRYLSEDWFFCQRWLDLGGIVYADTRIIAKHVGHAVYPLWSQVDETRVEKLQVVPRGMRNHIENVLQGEYSIELEEQPRRVLDIGGNIGAFSVWAAKHWPDARIDAYEPHPDNANLFRINTRHLKHIDLHEQAVRNKSCAAKLAEGVNNCGEASFHLPGDHSMIPVCCIGAACLEPADFIKIDTEGCELEILEHLDLSRARGIALEFHSQNDKTAITDLLTLRGFTLLGDKRLSPETGVLKFIPCPANSTS